MDKEVRSQAVRSRDNFLHENCLITQPELCELLGRSAQALRRWEAGAEPRFPQARIIARRKYWLVRDIERFLRELPDESSCPHQSSTADQVPHAEGSGQK